LDQQLTQLFDRRQRTNWNDRLREDLERQAQAVTAKMRVVCGGL